MDKLKEYLRNCNEVYHTTIDPHGPGVVRIHLVPPEKLKPGIPWVAILNGYYILPLQTSWAILLKMFIEKYNKTEDPINHTDDIIDRTVETAKILFFQTSKTVIKKDLKDIIYVLKQVAKGKTPDRKIGFTTLKEYSRFMSAPHRMDLMVSAMTKCGNWNCNQKCTHCYAAGEFESSKEELTKEQWFTVLDKLKEAHIPQVTFTGGEPTIRSDLVELVDYARWFVTRLNTNGILLTEELSRKLYEASLDSVQVTFYSSNPDIHNNLVGGNHFDETVLGIKNALSAGLDLSVNTPLCSLNKDYTETVKFLHEELGVTYFSCSGLIPSGNATGDESESLRLSNDEITKIVKDAYSYTSVNECELSFTSPGWISENELKKMRMVVPSCGACLSNMAIAPDGDVLPCQSWLFEEGLGNILDTDWKRIWNNRKCRMRRRYSKKNEMVCPLKEVKK